MEKQFTIYLYKDLVKITYDGINAPSKLIFDKIFIKKFKFPDNNRVLRFIIRWRVKKFIKNKLAFVIGDIFEFEDFSIISYDDILAQFNPNVSE